MSVHATSWVYGFAAQLRTTVLISLLLSGCGGGSGGGATPITGSARVTVTDVLGDPVSGAYVELGILDGPSYRQVGAFADVDGIVSFSNVTSRGPVNAYAWDGEKQTAESPFGSSENVTLVANGRIELHVTVAPPSHSLFGVASASVDPSGVAGNGRSLAFSVGLVDTEADYLSLHPCTPDPQNDASAYPADCVAGTNAVDAPYEESDVGSHPPPQTSVPNGSIGPFAVAVLLDQSSHIAATDPDDTRIFALEYFLTTLHADDRVVLAAFASDDAASGRFAALPQTPVTMFPTGNPQFTEFNRDLFTHLDSLPTLEGGAAPLYAAIDTMLDFTAAHASSNLRRAIVVLTDGDDDTCGSRAECEQARKQLIDKSLATGIQIILISLENPPSAAGRATLTAFAGSGAGSAFWIDSPNRLAGTLPSLRSMLDGTTQILETHFQIESPVDGAFQTGRAVQGTVSRECNWGDCDDTSYFSIPIP